MGEKPSEADETQARHDMSKNAIGNIRAREAVGSDEGTLEPVERSRTGNQVILDDRDAQARRGGVGGLKNETE